MIVKGWRPSTLGHVLRRTDCDDGTGVFRLMFRCVGCGFHHGPWIGEKQHPDDQRWSWNGSMTKPVFTPSLLVRWPQYRPEALARDRAYEKVHGHWPERVHNEADWDQKRCHSFVGCNGAEPGQIIYLGDSTHAMAGKVVDLPPIDDWEDEID